MTVRFDYLTQLPAQRTTPGASRIILSNLERCDYEVESSPSGINIVLDGEETYEVEGARMRVRAGEMILISAGHRLRVVLERRDGNRAICVCLPSVDLPAPAVVVSAANSDLGRYLAAAGDVGAAAMIAATAQQLPRLAETVGRQFRAIPSRRWQTSQRVLQQVDRAAAYLKADIDQPADLKRLADTAGMSVHHFARTFAAVYGCPPARFQGRVRMEQAAAALMSGTSAAAAAERFGFADQASFTRAFRRHKGISPAAWARSQARE
ncbi:AraC family transcriptional regulator [Sphingomonas sinipercae]|uniref:AraC family transcriptional regulator n=1 Tax=Sphingomonas sinipercae TaxID=2714944 RepID=A0A6G7ZKK5_9SPHN|nr:AraC family transcriptional regulator [Sphingomonas sinipercae]QIL01527.1 AraC family transcriptional regulator [Sphingomonas sinipercae]